MRVCTAPGSQQAFHPHQLLELLLIVADIPIKRTDRLRLRHLDRPSEGEAHVPSPPQRTPFAFQARGPRVAQVIKTQVNALRAREHHPSSLLPGDKAPRPHPSFPVISLHPRPVGTRES